MNGYYNGMIKVVCVDRMCFRVDPATLEARSCSCYDPWALTDPDPEPVETISHSEWCLRLYEREQAERQRWRQNHKDSERLCARS